MYPLQYKGKFPIPLTQEDIKKMIGMAKSTKERLLLQFLYSSGLRVMEVAKLKKKDLFLSLNKGVVREGKRK